MYIYMSGYRGKKEGMKEEEEVKKKSSIPAARPLCMQRVKETEEIDRETDRQTYTRRS